MNHVIAPPMIETRQHAAHPDPGSAAAGRARRRAAHRFLDTHSSSGPRALYRLVCALAGERA